MTVDVHGLLRQVGLPPEAGDRVTVSGSDPVFASPYPIGEAAASVLGACGATAALLWQEATGQDQTVRVEVARAAASLTSVWVQRMGSRLVPGYRGHAPLVDFYRCGDGRHIFLHGVLPHLANGLLELLKSSPAREDLATAVRRWDAQALEDAAAERGLCAAMVRGPDEWAAHPQGAAVGALPLIEVERIGDSEPESVPAVGSPLGGLRVLDLTRMLAGPTVGKHLAAHGADVLLVQSPFIGNPLDCLIDTSLGKLSAYLNLDDADQLKRMRELAATCDVFVQSCRPGVASRRGLGAEELASLRPGIVYVSVSCYGSAGPWQDRPGWEQLAQAVSGLAATQGTMDAPALVPAVYCDYTTGYLGALGAMAALDRRRREGGSYHVRVSLVQTAMWLVAQGQTVDRTQARELPEEEAWFAETDTAYGRLRQLTPALEMSATPPRWRRPTVPPGTHAPAWPDARDSDGR